MLSIVALITIIIVVWGMTKFVIHPHHAKTKKHEDTL
jgi:hypothetical protein